MTQDERRRPVAAALEADPDASQREIARAIGCSQATVMRDIAWLRGESAMIHLVGEDDSPPQQVSPQEPEPSRGDELVKRLRDEMKEQGLIPTSVEEEHLADARDLRNRIAELQDIVAVDGERRRTKDGRIFMHPAISEIRQSQAALARILAGINTMVEPQVNRTAQRAAQTRWRRKNMQRMAAGDGPVT